MSIRKIIKNQSIFDNLKNPIVKGIEYNGKQIKLLVSKGSKEFKDLYNEAERTCFQLESCDIQGPDRPLSRIKPHRSAIPIATLKGESPSIMAGFQVRNKSGYTGTIGPLVEDLGTKKVGFLTNWHVAKDYEDLSDPYLYQSKYVENPITIPDRHIINVSGDACYCPFLDEINNFDRQNRTWKDRRLPIKKSAMPILGEIVYKTGRTTGYTRGIVEAHSAIKIQYKTIELPVEVDCFKIVPHPDDGDVSISDGGDSGSGWYAIRGGEAFWVGLNFAGESSSFFPEKAYACYMPLVLTELGLKIL